VLDRRTSAGELLPNDDPNRYLSQTPVVNLSGSESLFHNLLLHPDDEHPLHLFRDDEYCDADGDGHVEFADGWGRPIYFLRWAPDHCNQPANALTPLSMIQFSDPHGHHDAMDPHGIDKTGFMLWPLIVSAGSDSELGIRIPNNSKLFYYPPLTVNPFDRWTEECFGRSPDGLSSSLTTSCKDDDGIQFGGLLNIKQAVDNISNHLLKQ
jgi:hypothetical protein